MKKVVVAISVFLSGCVSYSDPLINADGHVVNCQNSGFGLLGAPLAAHASNTCIESWKTVGYVELDEAGGIGVLLSSESGSLRIISVMEKSPAALAGIVSGDYLVAVEHQPVSNVTDARRLLFGKPNVAVSITFRRAETTTDITLVRVSYASLQSKK